MDVLTGVRKMRSGLGRFCLAITINLIASCFAQADSERGPTYRFSGVFAPTDRSPTSLYVATSPEELMGREFTVTVSWPANSADYSIDFNPGNDKSGVYRSELISAEISVPGFNFSIPPTISSWSTINDSGLKYVQGVPIEWGDELQLASRAIRTQRIETISATTIGQTELETSTYDWMTEYHLSLHAVDASGTLLADDSLQTTFDLTRFDYLRFEFIQSVPIAGGDPKPVYHQHWMGIVNSVVAIPEPSAFGICSVTLFLAAFHRLRAIVADSESLRDNFAR
jgi:hypothetical protein